MAYYIAEGAVVKGQVTMADGASVWYNATVRGDSEPIEIGRKFEYTGQCGGTCGLKPQCQNRR